MTRNKIICEKKAEINQQTKQIKIRSSREIGEILRTGKRINGKYVSFVYNLCSDQNDIKAAFITSRKIKRAVDRNRLKRLMRETVRQRLDQLMIFRKDKGLELILLANRTPEAILLKNIEEDFNQFLLAIDRRNAG